MSVFSVANYTITDPDLYMKYVENVGKSVVKFGGKTIVADHDLTPLEGISMDVIIIVQFESKEILLEWYNSESYQKIIDFRKNSTKGWVTICKEFIPMNFGGQNEDS